MPARKKCSCKGHEKYCVIDSRKFKVCVLNHLKSNNELFEHSTFLCTACAAAAENQLKDTAKKSVNFEDFFDDFIDAIASKYFDEDRLAKVASAIGLAISEDIIQDGSLLGSKYQDDTFLQSLTLEDYLNARNKVLMALLFGLSPKIENVADTAKQNVKMAKAVEHIYQLSCNPFVAPVCFSSNLLTYYITGSKNACILNSSGSPSGSYDSILNWINDHSTEQIHCLVDPDVFTFFDNNQVLEKKWRVKFNYKSSTSVLTTIVHIIPDPDKQLQTIEDLSPKHWLSFTSEDKTKTIDHFKDKNEKYDKIFDSYRNKFIQEKLYTISSEQTLTGENFHDYIDDGCRDDTHTPNANSERYAFVPSCYGDTTPEVKMGEPCMENPCSYEAVEKVFEHIIADTINANTNRKWTIVGCDALPFTLGSRIVENTFVCQSCTREYEDVQQYEEHKQKSNHDAGVPINFARKYNNIILIPGLGHYEINMVKSVFKLLWEVGLKDLAKQLGFKSPKALLSCQSATDHHKSWQILQIFFHSMSEELMMPYCRLVLSENKKPCLSGFYDFISKSKNPNFRFLCDAVFTYLFALNLFRAGVRRNNADIIHASLHKFSPLFYGFDMPFYMETYLRDRLLRDQCPSAVEEVLNRNTAFSTSGCESKGEGGDFVVENRNRKVKRCLSSGVPDEKKWLNIYRNIDRLDKVRSNMYNLCSISEDDKEYQYQYNLDSEKREFRRFIRKQKYLETPQSSGTHCSVSGKELDKDLLFFDETSAKNQANYFNSCKQEKLNIRKKLAPIFILPEDREKYYSLTNTTKCELEKMVDEKLCILGQDSLFRKWKKVRNLTKSSIIDFLQELQTLLEN